MIAGFKEGVNRDMQRMQDRMKHTRAYYNKLLDINNFSSHKANYQKYFFSESGKGTYSITYNQENVE